MILWRGIKVRTGGLAWTSMHTSWVATTGIGRAPFGLLLSVFFIQAEVVQEE